MVKQKNLIPNRGFNLNILDKNLILIFNADFGIKNKIFNF